VVFVARGNRRLKVVQYIQWFWFAPDGSLLNYVSAGEWAYLFDGFGVFVP
jgi:hypothetical protein